MILLFICVCKGYDGTAMEPHDIIDEMARSRVTSGLVRHYTRLCWVEYIGPVIPSVMPV